MRINLVHARADIGGGQGHALVHVVHLGDAALHIGLCAALHRGDQVVDGLKEAHAHRAIFGFTHDAVEHIGAGAVEGLQVFLTRGHLGGGLVTAVSVGTRHRGIGGCVRSGTREQELSLVVAAVGHGDELFAQGLQLHGDDGTA